MAYRCGVVVASLLFLGCGPAVDDPEESDGESGMQSLQCVYGDVEVEEGEEYDDPSGCLRWQCEDGALVLLEDLTFSVPGDLTLDTQAAVDERMCMQAVEGTLTITGTASDLAPLAQLGRVQADLVVDGSAVQNLSLLALTEVGGNIQISNNTMLTALGFLPYMSAFGDATIQNNDALTSLAGAGFLGACAGCDQAPEPPPGGDSGSATGPGAEGETGNGEDPVSQFYGGILIADNDILTDISVMAGLVVAWDDLRLRNNASLSSLPNMMLREVQGDLEITNHPALDTTLVDNLVAGVLVSGVTVVCGNLGGTPCP